MIPRRFRSQGTALVHDALMIPIAWLMAYILRFNITLPPTAYFESGINALAIIFPIQFIAFWGFGLYRGVWRFASLPDILRILKAVIAGTAVSMAFLFILSRGVGVPRSVPILYTLLLIVFLSGPRVIYRWIKDHRIYLVPGQRVLIVGAGDAGEMLARELLRNQDTLYLPIAFVDDNSRQIGREIHGLPIAGQCEEIPSLVDKLDIDIIMLAVPSASSDQMQRIVEFCEQSGIPFRSVPQLKDLMSGHVQINDIREISIEDLLGREPVSLDWPAIKTALSDKAILVTGGGGSIGSELCRQLVKLNPAILIVLDNSEYNLYSIEIELQSLFPKQRLICHLGDVTDLVFLEYIFSRNHPDVVFHAAAYKHVPILEAQIRQAIRNNVLGTCNVANLADRSGCDTFVLVSTDKAVNPANVMGASKRIAEIFCQNLNAHSDTNYITVRFGNVLGSTGSVIPLFKKQIAAGGPITVTDPRIERYFMTIPEASQLIMETVVLGNGGEIFVLDMGNPVKIKYLAEQLIRLSGKTPDKDIKIEYIGLRPGEKLYEELFHEKELLEKTTHKKVFLSLHREVDWIWLNKLIEQMAVACDQYNTEALQTQLSQLVPEYTKTQTLPKVPTMADAAVLD